jgi:hypothetical protein
MKATRRYIEPHSLGFSDVYVFQAEQEEQNVNVEKAWNNFIVRCYRLLSTVRSLCQLFAY